MKIYGIGTDITNIQRIKKSIKNKKIINRIFNISEVKRCEKQVNKANCYAKRFAAKEAFAKAFGTGISGGIKLNEIIIQNNMTGKPEIKLTGKTKKIIKKKIKKKINIFLTLTDDKTFAVATVVISI